VYTPVIPVALPLLVAALLAALNRVMPRWLASLLAIVAAAAVAFAALSMVIFSRDAPIFVYWFGDLPPAAGAARGIGFVIDNSGAMLVLLSSLLVTFSLVLSYRYFDSVGPIFQALMLVLLAAMNGFSQSGDLFNLFVFYELMTAAAISLSVYHPDCGVPLKNVLHLGIANVTGATLVLAGIALVYLRTGAVNMAQAGRALASMPSDSLIAVAFALMMCGFLMKAAIAPFHFWLPEALVAAPAPVCAVIGGIMAELGIYGAVRVYWAVFSGVLAPHSNELRNLLVAFAAVTAILGALASYMQRHLKKLLAFSIVSHSGVMLLGVAMLTPEALAGASIYMMGHALLTGGLFLAAAIVVHRLGVMDELHLLGRARHMRYAGLLFFVGAIGLAGLPPFGIFWGDVMMDGAAHRLGYYWIPWVTFLAAVLTSAAVFRFCGRVFFGWGPGADSEPLPVEAIKQHSGTPFELYAGATLLLIAGLATGLAPRLTGAAESAALYVQNREAYAQRVLDNLAPFPVAVHDVPAGPIDILRCLAALLIAAFVARQTLCSPTFRRAFGRLRALPRALHASHAGEIGESIAWLSVGLAIFMGFAFVCLR